MAASTATAINMSLDDIIAQSKSSRGQKTVIGPDGLPRNRRSQQAGNPRRGAGAARSAARSSLTPYSNPRSAPASIPAIDQSKLSVSNLNHNVTSQDFRELFSTIGPVKSAVLNFDHTGKSTGTGTVIYKRAGDTQRAITEFNGRLFDGRPMRIELVVSATNIASLTKPLVVPNNLSGGQRGAGANSRGARGRGAGRASRGGKKDVGKTPEEIAAQLDAEMDKYMQDESMGEAVMSI